MLRKQARVLFVIMVLCSVTSAVSAAIVVDFDSAQNVSVDGIQVTEWISAVGGLSAQPGNGEVLRQPTLVPNVFGSGQPGVRFDGIDDFLTFDDSTLPTGDFTVALAWQPENLGSAASRPTMFSWGNDQNNKMREIAFAHRPSFHDPPNAVITRFNGSDANSTIPGGPGATEATGAATNGVNYIAVFARDAFSGDYFFHISDGTTLSSETINNGSSALELEQGRLGSFTDGGGDFNEAIFGGYLGRVVVNDTLLDTSGQLALLTSLESYVSGGVTLPSEFSWSQDATGAWASMTNWTPAGIPGTSEHTAVFGAAITANRTVTVDENVTVQNIEFDNVNTYAIAGTGTVQLDAGTAAAATLNVVQGTHEFQARVALLGDVSADINTGSTLEFNNRLNLNGSTLTKTGEGTLAVNNRVTAGAGGAIVGGAGVISGSGTVGGDLSNNAVVAPGNSPGILTVDGNFTQSAGGTLEIELASNGGVAGTDHDRLAVTLAASLDGTLDLQLDGGYTPTIGDSFAGIVTAGTRSGSFATTNNVVIDGRRGVAVTYTETAVNAQIGLRGNTDIASGDVDVDTSDLTTSIINFTSAGGTGKVWADGDMDGDGDVDTSDLTTSIINFTSALGAGGAVGSAVPEPSSLILLLLGMTVMWGRRRR